MNQKMVSKSTLCTHMLKILFTNGSLRLLRLVSGTKIGQIRKNDFLNYPKVKNL